MRESDIEQYLIAEVTRRGGTTTKVRWIGRRGAPDRRIWGKCWVEVKAPGEKLKPYQDREHRRMRAHGERVEVVDTFMAVSKLMRDLYGC